MKALSLEEAEAALATIKKGGAAADAAATALVEDGLVRARTSMSGVDLPHYDRREVESAVGIAVARLINSSPPPNKWSAYVTTVAANTVRKVLAAKKKEEDWDSAVDELPDPRTNNLVMQNEKRSILMMCVAQLEEREQDMIRARFWERSTLDVIAKEWELPDPMASKRVLESAYKKLRTMLAEWSITSSRG